MEPRDVFHKKAILKKFAIWKGKHLCRGLFFIKVAGLRPLTVLKKGLQHRYFLVNVRKFIKIPILKNICERLLLHFWKLFCENILILLPPV